MKKHKKNMAETVQAVPRATLHDLLPQDKESHAILLARAKIIAHEQAVETRQENLLGGVYVRLGEADRYAIPFANVIEVLGTELVTPVPKLPEMIAGISNWRGKILTVVDLRSLFGLKEAESETTKCVVIVSAQSGSVGLLVDDILGSTSYDPASLKPPMAMKGMVKQGYISGLLNGVVSVLNLDAILADVNAKIKI